MRAKAEDATARAHLVRQALVSEREREVPKPAAG
jgi:hypothetical protein